MFRILGIGHFQKWVGKQIGHPAEYWEQYGTWLDCRGPLFVDPTSVWGYNVTIITASHSLRPEDGFKHIFWPVIVEAGAWICSNTLLFNCKIGRGAVVAAGCVVRSRDVPLLTMVEGNPARIIAKFDTDLDVWVYLEEPEEIPVHAMRPSGREPGFMEDHETW